MLIYVFSPPDVQVVFRADLRFRSLLRHVLGDLRLRG